MLVLACCVMCLIYLDFLDLHLWSTIVFQSGLIHSKAMPQLVLSRSEHAITVTYGDKVVEGDPVVVSKR